jgi:hypothetical protein
LTENGKCTSDISQSSQAAFPGCDSECEDIVVLDDGESCSAVTEGKCLYDSSKYGIFCSECSSLTFDSNCVNRERHCSDECENPDDIIEDGKCYTDPSKGSNPPENPSRGGFPWWLWLIIAAVALLLLIVIIALIIRQKKKKEKDEDMESAGLYGSSSSSLPPMTQSTVNVLSQSKYLDNSNNDINGIGVNDAILARECDYPHEIVFADRNKTLAHIFNLDRVYFSLNITLIIFKTKNEI